MKLNMQDEGRQNGELEVVQSVFDTDYNETLIHQVVTAILAGERQGSKAQKTRAEVRGGGIKPWRQKGTGRARAGSIRSPIWRTGGVTFAAKPRSYKQKVNKKMYRCAMRSILSELNRQGRLIIVSDFVAKSSKTKEMKETLNRWNLEKILIVSDQVDDNLYLSTRNIPYVNVCEVSALDPVTLVSSEKVMLTAAAVKELEEQLA